MIFKAIVAPVEMAEIMARQLCTPRPPIRLYLPAVARVPNGHKRKGPCPLHDPLGLGLFTFMYETQRREMSVPVSNTHAAAGFAQTVLRVSYALHYCPPVRVGNWLATYLWLASSDPDPYIHDHE